MSQPVLFGSAARDGETLAASRFREQIRAAIAAAAPYIAHLGDGNGGYMQLVFEEEMQRANVTRPEIGMQRTKKREIGRSLSKAVFERDAYRCVMCSSHVDLSCDHIISEHDGGPTTLENLQTMCRSCNSSKGKKSFSVLREKAA
jgi:5-methylcytosine-specific restriction endonuclease McrA